MKKNLFCIDKNSIFSFGAVAAAICFAATPFDSFKLGDRGISLYLYVLFAVCLLIQIVLLKGIIQFERLRMSYVFFSLFVALSYKWVSGYNYTVEADYSTFIKGVYFLVLLSLASFTDKNKHLFQLSLSIGTVAMAVYMILGGKTYMQTDRLTLVFGSSVSEVNYLAFLFVIPIGFLIHLIISDKSNIIIRASAGAGSLLLIYAMVMMGSRAGLLSVISTALFTVLSVFFSHDKITTKSFIWFTMLLTIVLLAFPYVIQALPKQVLSRLSITNFLISTSGANGRVDIWKRAFDAILNEQNIFCLLFGHGYMSSKIFFGITLHNLFIQVFYEQGVIGLIWIIYIMFRIFRNAWENENGLMISELFGFFILCMSLPCVNTRYFWICLMVLVICCDMKNENIEGRV